MFLSNSALPLHVFLQLEKATGQEENTRNDRKQQAKAKKGCSYPRKNSETPALKKTRAPKDPQHIFLFFYITNKEPTELYGQPFSFGEESLQPHYNQPSLQKRYPLPALISMRVASCPSISPFSPSPRAILYLFIPGCFQPDYITHSDLNRKELLMSHYFRSHRGDRLSLPPNDNPENGETNGDTPNGYHFDAHRLFYSETRQVNGETNGEHPVRQDAGVREAPRLTAEHPSTFVIDRANRSVLINFHDNVPGPILYSHTLSSNDTSPGGRFTIYDSSRSITSVIEYHSANDGGFPQLHQRIYRGDINTITSDYEQIMNGELNNENRERMLDEYLLEHRVYTLRGNSFHITSSGSSENTRELFYSF
jgi:hypothetical protein